MFGRYSRLHINWVMTGQKERRKEGRKEGRKVGRKTNGQGRKEGRKTIVQPQKLEFSIGFNLVFGI